jgi:hypothetical protein
MSWSTVLLISAGAFVFKAAGMFGLGRLVSNPRTIAIARLLPPALIAGLVIIQTFTDTDGAFTVDSRIAGVAAGVIAAWRGAPFWLVAVIAASVTASLRLLGV